MSDARAIEAVTKTLLQLIDDACNSGPGGFPGGVKVVAQPPHEVTDQDPLKVNLFLYRTEVDAALRNEDPLDLRAGESGNPPLPLILRYLVTPYVQGGDDIDAHRLLGLAVRTVHEHTVLTREMLTDSGSFSNVASQLDRIRLTWQPLADNDIYSLWSAFQSPYRLSAALEVRAVLIDGRDAQRTPVPVLHRGALDEGPVARADVTSPFPELAGVEPVDRQAAARPGETVRVHGANLAAQAVTVQLTHPLVVDPVPVPVAAADVTSNVVSFVLPAAGLPAGLWSLVVELTNTVADEQITTATNAIPLAVAPRITSPMPMTVPRVGPDVANVNLTCDPPVLDGQPVLLLVGATAVHERRSVDGNPVVGSALAFVVSPAELGTQPLRLRIGGVDTLLVDRSQDKPRFDPTQRLTVTP